jgi:hypothetical protein
MREQRKRSESIDPFNPTIQELEVGLLIDENNLEKEAGAQPDAYYRVSKRHVLEISRRDAAKQALEDEEAKALISIKNTAERQGERVTEKHCDALVRMDKDVRIAREAFLKAQAAEKEWAVLKESFQQRSYALAHLVDLFVRNYYGEVVGRNEQKNRDAQYAREHSRHNRSRNERVTRRTFNG